MADLQRNGSDPSDPSLDLFDYDKYYGEHYPERESNADAEAQGSSSSPSPGRMSRFEPHHDHVDSPKVAVNTRAYTHTLADNRFESLGEPSQHPTTTGNGPLHQYGQPSRSDIPSAELRHVEGELEEVELRIKYRELLRRRRELLQNLPTGQQAQTFSRPKFQNLGTASNSSNQPNDHGIAPNEASQRIDLFPAATVLFNNNWVDHSYNTDVSTSGKNSMGTVKAAVDNPLRRGFCQSFIL